MKNKVLASGIALAMIVTCRLGFAQQMNYLPPSAYGPAPGYAPQGYMQAPAYGPYGNSFGGGGHTGFHGGSPAGSEGVCGDCGSSNCDRCSGCFGGCGCGRRSGERTLVDFYADVLYLRARNAEVAYSVPIDGPVVAPPEFPAQVGPVGIVDQDFELGFRTGATLWLDNVSSIRGQYTWFETEADHTSNVVIPGIVLQSLVQHPDTQDAATDSLSAFARHKIDFQRVDLDYRSILWCGPRHEVTLLGGLCYANLEQDFYSEFEANDIELVETNLQFEGIGLRVGIEAERHGRRGFMAYGRGHASFIGGEFEAMYQEGVGTDLDQIFTTWEAGRVVSIFDLEAGVGWVSESGFLRVTAGYMVSAWLNTLTTDDWIQAVHQNDFVSMGDKMTFDGLTGRVEIRF